MWGNGEEYTHNRGNRRCMSNADISTTLQRMQPSPDTVKTARLVAADDPEIAAEQDFYQHLMRFQTEEKNDISTSNSNTSNQFPFGEPRENKEGEVSKDGDSVKNLKGTGEALSESAKRKNQPSPCGDKESGESFHIIEWGEKESENFAAPGENREAKNQKIKNGCTEAVVQSDADIIETLDSIITKCDAALSENKDNVPVSNTNNDDAVLQSADYRNEEMFDLNIEIKNEPISPVISELQGPDMYFSFDPTATSTQHQLVSNQDPVGSEVQQALTSPTVNVQQASTVNEQPCLHQECQLTIRHQRTEVEVTAPVPTGMMNGSGAVASSTSVLVQEMRLISTEIAFSSQNTPQPLQLQLQRQPSSYRQFGNIGSPSVVPVTPSHLNGGVALCRYSAPAIAAPPPTVQLGSASQCQGIGLQLQPNISDHPISNTRPPVRPLVPSLSVNNCHGLMLSPYINLENAVTRVEDIGFRAAQKEITDFYSVIEAKRLHDMAKRPRPRQLPSGIRPPANRFVIFRHPAVNTVNIPGRVNAGMQAVNGDYDFRGISRHTIQPEIRLPTVSYDENNNVAFTNPRNRPPGSGAQQHQRIYLRPPHLPRQPPLSYPPLLPRPQPPPSQAHISRQPPPPCPPHLPRPQPPPCPSLFRQPLRPRPPHLTRQPPLPCPPHLPRPQPPPCQSLFLQPPPPRPPHFPLQPPPPHQPLTPRPTFPSCPRSPRPNGGAMCFCPIYSQWKQG